MGVRVRGIYATAITKILLDRGFIITLPSETIAKRFSIPILTDPPDVTVKTDEIDPEKLVIIGFPEPQRKVVNALKSVLKYSGVVESKIGANALVIGKVLEKVRSGYLIDLGFGRTIIRTSVPLKEGEKRVFRIRIPPTTVSDKFFIDVTPGIIGRYARVFKSREAPSVSKHIKDESKRRFLIDLARNLPKEYTVHRRSSAEYATPDKLVAELKELVERLERILSTDGDVGDIIYEGERVTFFYLSTADRYLLDKIRDKVIPTVTGHHARKSASRYVESDLSPAVDVLEKALEITNDRESLEKAMKAYALEKDGVTIVHRKPDGAEIRIKGARIVSRGEHITLYRELSGRGTYDGLNMPIEPGDYAITRVYPGERYVIHEYYSKDGTLKGIYANVNTPPEFMPGVIRYTDLYVDVVMRSGEEPRIIDVEELESRLDRGLISRELYEKAMEVAKNLIERLNARTLRCFLPRTPRSPLSTHRASLGTPRASRNTPRPYPLRPAAGP